MSMSISLRMRISVVVFAALVAGCTSSTDPEATSEGGATFEGGGGGQDAAPAGPACGRLTTLCAPGDKCAGAPDCASKICRTGVCQEGAPADGTKNGDETDVDCGGTKAPACADGKGCVGADDCTSGVCKTNICQAPTHTDGVKNGTETGLDCGGAGAPKCAAGQGCTSNADCNNLKCDPTQKMCLAASHTDGLKNDGETGVDCGGTALPSLHCPTGEGCLATADCNNAKCDVGATNLCLAPSHTDGIKNDGETGADCGGTAPLKCSTGEGCLSNADCNNVKCDVGATNLCLAPSHTDGVKNLGETGIDCGGAALPAKCPTGQGCAGDGDCNNVLCTAGLVCDSPTKVDGLKNGTETDIDCGGGAPTNAPKCGAGLSCDVAGVGNDANCLSAVCSDVLKCVESPSCRPQHGGYTCGPAGNESCCKSLPAGGSNLDKYNITAGRMRTFVTAVGGNMRTYITNNKPAWWTDAWTAFLPTMLDNGLITPDDNPAFTGVYQELGPYVHGTSAGGNRGCNVGGPGARTYRLPDAVNTRMADPQSYTQAFLDERSLNCVTVYIVAAFCAWDGGKLPTFGQLDAAWGNGTYPWGNATAPLGYQSANPTDPAGNATGARGAYQSAPFPAAPLSAQEKTDLLWANYNMNYWGGSTQLNTDYSNYVAPPGRFPNGNGPLGHADLAGNVFNSTDINNLANTLGAAGATGSAHWSRSGSWQGHTIPWAPKGSETNFPGHYKYWAMGGRCAR